MADGWQRLHGLEEQASSWLSAVPDVIGAPTAAVFDTLLHVLRHRHGDLYDEAVPANEALIEVSLCMSQGHQGMPLPLPDIRADCSCAHLTNVKVDAVFLSGSARENCSVSLMNSCASDVDVMLQLGGVTVEEEEGTIFRPEGSPSAASATASAAGETHHTEGGDSCREEMRAVDSRETGMAGDQNRTGTTGGEEPGAQKIDGVELRTSRGPIVVSMERTDQPGFFLLRHRRRPSCRHRQPLPLSAQRVVGLIDTLRQSLTRRPPSYSGPAVSATVSDFSHNARDVDLVACLRCPVWPHGDFASRQRQSGWPNAALVARLCRTAAFLVPVGFRGSVTEPLQWRISFSRQEYIVLRLMTADQRMCLTALKYCRAVVGQPAKPVKSYYLKTALMWLAESRAADQWTPETMLDSLLLILRYLDVCGRRGYMPCYFWPEVNLLAGRSAEERAELTAATAEMRRRLLPAVLALLADWLGQPVPTLAQRLLLRNERLSTDQFRCLTVVNAVGQALSRSPVSAEDSAGDDKEPSADALLNLVFFGKNQTAGSLVMSHPLFSGMSLTVDMLERIGGRNEISRLFGGFLNMCRRWRDSKAEDSWLAEV